MSCTLFLDELETHGTIKPISNLCFSCLFVYLASKCVTRNGMRKKRKNLGRNLLGNLLSILLLLMMTFVTIVEREEGKEERRNCSRKGEVGGKGAKGRRRMEISYNYTTCQSVITTGKKMARKSWIWKWPAPQESVSSNQSCGGILLGSY